MDRLTLYRQAIEEILVEYGSDSPVAGSDVVYQQVRDYTNDHYYLMRIGWIDQTRIHNCIFHCDIIDNKIWLQEDWTASGIAHDLERRGISKSEIVLAYNPIYIRQIAGGDYAVQ